MDYLPCVEIEPQGTANCSVIWLHGLGADGNDFAPLVPQLRLNGGCSPRFVFPHAPRMPVTINGGMVMRAWYDIADISIERKVDSEQLRRSARAVEALVERERQRGIDSRRIVLAGFSQGGAVAYELALSYPRPLAGLLVLSSYLARGEQTQRHPANATLPILIQHGLRDPVVPESLGQKAAAQLKAWDYPVTYQQYPVEHGVCPEQIPVISRWLGERLTLGAERRTLNA